MPIEPASNGAEMPRRAEYLFRRKGSQNWYVKFQYPGELADHMGTRQREISLGTPDRREAEIRALPHIVRHKQALLVQRAGGVQEAIKEVIVGPFPAGEHLLEDGKRVISTGSDLVILDANGKLIRTMPNGPKRRFFYNTDNPAVAEYVKTLPKPSGGKATPDSGDDAILERWIKNRNIPDSEAKQARRMLTLFKELVPNKSLSQCTRMDGLVLVTHLQERGAKPATIQRKVGYLPNQAPQALGGQDRLLKSASARRSLA